MARERQGRPGHRSAAAVMALVLGWAASSQATANVAPDGGSGTDGGAEVNRDAAPPPATSAPSAVTASPSARAPAPGELSTVAPRPVPTTAISRFGRARTWAISGDYLFSETGVGFILDYRTRNNASLTTLQLAPAFDYFVTDRLSVGILTGIVYQREKSLSAEPEAPGTATNWGRQLTIAARLGGTIAITDGVSIWPRASYTYRKVARNRIVTPFSARALQLYAPMVFHSVPHLFLGFGPYFVIELDTKAGDVQLPEGHSLGLAFTLGAWGGRR